ncbi:MAG TPA: nitroreductase/quinone reductase family protein [Candidatus Dormibacteraeota bacterium]|nr:nitroreductase/quinone reductase family protein [Candidatus Dormibacteraeota bacterium]
MTVEITPNGTRGFQVPGAFRPLARLHARLYKLVGGRGHGNMVVLSTLGSTTGIERSSTVAGFPEGEGRWLVVASMGGAAKHPSWYVNLAKKPDHVFLQVGNERFRVRASSLHGEDRAVAWKRITAEAPNFAEYQTKTDREIPVVRLTRR